MRHTQKVIFSQLERTHGAFKNPVKGAFGIGAFVRLTSKAMPEDRISLCVLCMWVEVCCLLYEKSCRGEVTVS